jgi:hypothetical protein
MNFIITPENEIECYLDNQLIAKSINHYERDNPDFWTSIDINHKLFDVNIWFEQEFNENTIPETISLYPLTESYNEKNELYYKVDFNDFETYKLEVKEEPLVYLIGEY